jgi:hypothetical protein
MKKVFAVVFILIILVAAISPMALASGTATLDLDGTDTGVTDPNILKPIDTPYPPSLNLLFIILGAAVFVAIVVFIVKKLIKNYRSKHRDIYGRW